MKLLISMAIVLGVMSVGAAGLDRPWLGLVFLICAAALVVIGLLFPVDDDVFPLPVDDSEASAPTR